MNIYIHKQIKEPLSIQYSDYLSILGDKNFHSINKNIMKCEIQNVDNIIIYDIGEKVDNIIEYIDSIELIYSFQKDLQLYNCDKFIIPRKKREQNQIQCCDRLIILKREKQKYKKQKVIFFCIQGEKKEQNQSEFYYIKELYKIEKSKNEKVMMNKIENINSIEIIESNIQSITVPSKVDKITFLEKEKAENKIQKVDRLFIKGNRIYRTEKNQI